MKKVGELKKHIYLCNSYEDRMLNELEALNVRRKLNLVTKKQYKKQITALLKGRSVDDWLNYYKDYKGACFKMIEEQNTDNLFRTMLFTLLLLILILPLGLNYTGFNVLAQKEINVDKIVSSNAYLLFDGVAQPIPLQTEFYNGEYVYKVKSLQVSSEVKKIEIMDNNQIVFSKELK